MGYLENPVEVHFHGSTFYDPITDKILIFLFTAPFGKKPDHHYLEQGNYIPNLAFTKRYS